MNMQAAIAEGLRTIAWEHDQLVILDQTRLPSQRHELSLRSMEQVFEAIQRLRVRGAPLIGVTAAFGLYLGMRDVPVSGDSDPAADLARCVAYLAGARPTAVNLTWALQRAASQVQPYIADRPAVLDGLLSCAQDMLAQDVATNRAIGMHGAPLVGDKQAILTHCNAGWLATAGYGTALAPLYVLQERGERLPHVYVDETRPVLQGARLTAWELVQAGIPATLICDNMAATVMAGGRVEAAIVGCDRMAANGDFANKIGTLNVAILAKEFGIPFYVALPTSSIDFSLSNGTGIPIEERGADEVRQVGGIDIAPEIAVFNPSFDVTPHKYVSAVITEHGVARPPFGPALRQLDGTGKL